jgi:Flp pilus assembly pilin Flp
VKSGRSKFDAAEMRPFEVAQLVPRAQWHRVVAHLAKGEAGQDVVEYGLMIATIAIVVLIGIMAFGAQIEPWFAHLAGRITTTGT